MNQGGGRSIPNRPPPLSISPRTFLYAYLKKKIKKFSKYLPNFWIYVIFHILTHFITKKIYEKKIESFRGMSTLWFLGIAGLMKSKIQRPPKNLPIDKLFSN